MNEIECEWDGCNEKFGTENGMKQHHVMAHGVSISGVEIECDFCGDRYRKKPALIERAEYNYCSKKCKNEHMGIRRSNKVEVECGTCGKPVERVSSQVEIHDNFYCSKECQFEGLSEYYQENEVAPNYEPEAKPWHDKKTLEELYLEKGMTITEIGDHFGVSQFTIAPWLRKHNIPKRKPYLGKRAERTTHHIDKRGYELAQARKSQIYIHTLVAISEGADPYDLFCEDYVVHHKNEVKWDNRPANLEVMTRSEHSIHHSEKNNPFGSE